jgi:uncharacterized membrane protein YtjA (UPF0391 family)
MAGKFFRVRPSIDGTYRYIQHETACPERRPRREGREMLSHALTFLSVGIIAGLPSLAGIMGVTTQVSWVLLVIGILLLVVHLMRKDRPPNL